MDSTLTVTPALLAGIAGVILSLAFRYIPQIHSRYDPLSTESKAGIMAGLIVLAAVAVYASTCGGFWTFAAVTCDKSGVVGLLNAVFFALIGNQTTYPLVKKPDASPMLVLPANTVVAAPPRTYAPDVPEAVLVPAKPKFEPPDPNYKGTPPRADSHL